MKDSRSQIAIVIPGGIGTGENNIGVPVLENLVRHLCANFGITVFQLYPTNKDYVADEFDLVDVYSTLRVVRAVKFVWNFWRLHRRKKFVAVHGFWAVPSGLLAVIVGKLFRIKSIVSLQGGDAISIPEIRYGQLQNPVGRRLVFWTLEEADEVISPSEYLVRNLHRLGLSRTNILYIPLGVDTSVFKFHDKPLLEPIQFLHIGTLSPVKDQETMLKAFQIIIGQVPAHLTIVGKGPLEEELKRLAKDLKIAESVTFLGLLQPASLPELYCSADILLHTSLSEGHPIVMEEAMSAGVVVCGTSVGLLSDLHECCVSVPPGDFGALARETLRLISEPVRMEAIKRNAHQWAAVHSLHWTISRINECYTV